LASAWIATTAPARRYRRRRILFAGERDWRPVPQAFEMFLELSNALEVLAFVGVFLSSAVRNLACLA